MKLTIKVTKEILERSKMCSPNTCNNIGESCAIALSVKDIFPNAYVSTDTIICDFFGGNGYGHLVIDLPEIAKEFIKFFDQLSPDQRIKMSEIEFNIQLSDEIISTINIDEIKPLLENHPTLSLA